MQLIPRPTFLQTCTVIMTDGIECELVLIEGQYLGELVSVQGCIFYGNSTFLS